VVAKVGAEIDNAGAAVGNVGTAIDNAGVAVANVGTAIDNAGAVVAWTLRTPLDRPDPVPRAMR
jgi:hypothetical protein